MTTDQARHPVEAPERIVVVGAGQAGLSVAARLRQLGFAGSLTLIGDEATPPYQRPPLSKTYLKRELAPSRLLLRDPGYFRREGIELVLTSAVLAIDARTRTVALADRKLGYDTLILATGGRPQHLPGATGGTLPGLHYLRSREDADNLARSLDGARSVFIVGGGYVGLETAASARQMGKAVTLIEAAPRILARVASVQTADYFRQLHRTRGVTLIEGVGIGELRFREGKGFAALLTDGLKIEADIVVVGIGMRPATELAADCGLKIDNGIWVDDRGRTSDPYIWAAGDCCSFPFEGRRIRLESVPHASDQANVIAANILGADQPYVARPWFWSDQYDVKLQIAGLGHDYDDVVAVRGASPGQQANWYFQNGRLIAVDAINDPRSYMRARKIIEAGGTIDMAELISRQPTPIHA